jgi:chromosome partitioning protein
MKRTDNARWWARAAALVIAGLAAIALVNWQATSDFVKTHEGIFKLAGYVFGPALAVLGFIFGRLDKAELADLSEQLGDAQRVSAVEREKAEAVSAQVAAKVARIEQLQSDLAAIADSRRLWKMRENRSSIGFPEYRGWKLDPLGAKIVAFGLFKGGVGKTHLAANFAAYVAFTKQLPVLLIDLDYQGSVSSMVLNAAGLEGRGSSVNALFSDSAGLATVSATRIHLARRGDDVALNDGQGLAQAWLIPADYDLTEVESNLLIERAMKDGPSLDERYRLARVLLNPEVRRQYAMIIIDTPPRMTLGTVNALVASHSLIVPTILDKVSSESVGPFLTQIRELEKDLKIPGFRIDGIVATMTKNLRMNDKNILRRDEIIQTASEFFAPSAVPFVLQNMPHKAAITDGNDLGYFLTSDGDRLRDLFYDKIFDELWTKIHSEPDHEANQIKLFGNQ